MSILLLLMSVWLAGPHATAAPRTPSRQDFTISSWQVEDGLPQSSVLSIAQSPDGYLWLATFNGLARFDGVRFTALDTSSLPGLPGNRFVRLSVDRTGALWVLTEHNQLVRITGGGCRTLGEAEGVPATGVRWVGEDGRGTLWLAGFEPGLRRWQGERFATASTPGAFAEGAIRGMLTDATGQPWFSHHTGLWGCAHGQWTVLPETSMGTNGVTGLCCGSREGGFWLLGEDGACKQAGGRWERRGGPLPEFKTAIVDMLEDTAGQLWVATYGSGLFCFTPDLGWQHFTVESGLTTLSLRCLCCDREGNLWVGTDGGGLMRITPRPWRMITRREGLGIDAVHSLCEDQQGRIWFAGGRGVPYCLVGEVVSVPIASPPSNPLEGVWSVLQARDGAMWIGTYRGLAVRAAAGAFASYGRAEGMLAGSVRAMLEDRQGAIWVGGFEGLSRIAQGQVTHYTKADGLTSEKVWALAEGPDGRLYIGTAGGGLSVFQNGNFTGVGRAQGLPDDHVRALHVDADGALWIGTRTGGLSRFKDGSCFNFASQGALPVRGLGPIVEDAAGQFWMASELGIVRARRSELEECVAGARAAVRFAVFDRSDGLATIEVGGVQPACLQARDGRLWFGTAKGAAVLDPKALRSNPLPPPVFIEEVRIDEQVAGGVGNHPAAARSQPPADGLQMRPHQRRVEFRFTGLHFIAPAKVRFRYRLEGLDPDWLDGGTARSASYTRPPPGQYRFRVTACNNDGVWNETGASLALLVLPPWWQTWWFRAVMLLGAGGAVFGFYEWRIRLLHHRRATQQEFSRRLIASQEEERKRIASELHDSLGQNLLVIKNMAALGGRSGQDDAAKLEKLTTISTLTSQAIGEVRDIARALRPFELDRLGLTKALIWLIKPAGDSSGIRFDVELDELDGLFPPEFEINLYRVVQESLANILKHSQATTARIQLKREPPEVRVVIRDDGRGFAPPPAAAPGAGMGLTDIAERVRIMGGQLAVESAPGTGTVLRMVIPLPQVNRRPTIGTE